ncbi:MAG: ferrous iron transport protein A [Ruminococcus sp.]|nr:ferrous iron transport protein A [Ruminococcus sp.]
MKSERNLGHLKEGERCIISAVKPTGISERLKELGFTAGTPVVCRCKSFSGDPTAYYVKGTVIALRKEDAAAISVL